MYNLYSLRIKRPFVSTKHKFYVLIVFLLIGSSITAEENVAPATIRDKKGNWNIQWGYNRDYYTQSDINFRGPGYNYSLKSVDARDKPESFKADVYLNPTKFEIPQYNLKFSYFFTDRFFLSFGEDHMKYVVTQGQPVKYSGYIDPGVIAKNQMALSTEAALFIYLFPGHVQEMAGYHGGDQTIALTPDILKYEHTDGLNYLFLDFGWITPLYTSSDGLSGLSLVSSIGGGPVVCRSDVRVLGKGQNNNFHLSGYGVSGYVATRYEFSRTYFLEFGGKGGYIDLTDVLTTGGSNRASQNFGFLELILSGGIAI
ncbi:hypothetical protein ND856_00750 [Leptospira bandrabouensis]|uniref:hypothetical protein n=1 Tax=Leptospira bandrabouensis TaxID=2484903 RepID=UPI00223DF23D|nr:hypothetical protein [Leptospira bandrabouensis]MCW7456850.1 hypothetical protein [Leptospira bandrabouensis]MCW7475796.1 hypothetical protein [Leptospira bandrabouensis]MCW7483478.1 hypothetical protein [Leptospira bandrabouensis]